MVEIPFVFSEVVFAAIWLLCRVAVWLKQKHIDCKREAMLLNVIGNTAMFIPSGIILPIIYRRLNCFWRVAGGGAFISLCIEII